MNRSSKPGRIYVEAGMYVMGVMSAKMDKTNVKHNRIEQITNLISQGMIMIGILIR